MSSKKERLRKRREQEQKRPRKKVNPAVTFLLGIVAVIVLVVAGVAIFGDGGPGDPPFPGATWSPMHGHWH